MLRPPGRMRAPLHRVGVIEGIFAACPAQVGVVGYCLEQLTGPEHVVSPAGVELALKPLHGGRFFAYKFLVSADGT